LDLVSYFILLFCFVMSIALLPQLYGQRFFDLRLVQAPLVSVSSETTAFQTAFIFDESSGRICRLYHEGQLVLRLEVERSSPGTKKMSLRELARLQPEPIPNSIPESVLEGFKKQLSESGVAK
jgi:hypothetical protein